MGTPCADRMLLSVYNIGVARKETAFREGDLVVLIDRKGRHYIERLDEGSALHTHAGVLPHTEIIGTEQGSWHRTTMSQSFLALKPTLAEFMLHMPRATQILYPKDIGSIIVLADIFPGANLVEAGLGSGALTMALLRAIGRDDQA